MRLRKDFITTEKYFKAENTLQASDMWKLLTTSSGGFDALEHIVRQIVGTEPTAVVVDGFNNLMAVVQILNWYSYELLGVDNILYNMQLTDVGCLYIAREARMYCSFEIDIEDILYVTLDLQYATPRESPANDSRMQWTMPNLSSGYWADFGIRGNKTPSTSSCLRSAESFRRSSRRQWHSSLNRRLCSGGKASRTLKQSNSECRFC